MGHNSSFPRENTVHQSDELILSAPSRVFFPHLDGLRFLAFFSVFLFHSFYTPAPSIEANALY